MSEMEREGVISSEFVNEVEQISPETLNDINKSMTGSIQTMKKDYINDLKNIITKIVEDEKSSKLVNNLFKAVYSKPQNEPNIEAKEIANHIGLNDETFNKLTSNLYGLSNVTNLEYAYKEVNKLNNEVSISFNKFDVDLEKNNITLKDIDYSRDNGPSL